MYKRQNLVRIVAVALLVYSLCSFAAVSFRIRQAAREEQVLRQELLLLQLRGEELSRQLEEGPDDEYLEELARERLGLVKSGEIVFYFR